jgi:hypothetical protein
MEATRKAATSFDTWKLIITPVIYIYNTDNECNFNGTNKTYRDA